MREIKFRAWDDELKRMFYSKNEQFDDSLLFRFQHFDTEEPIYMQFTGLRDKNGAEIYEGDIVLNRWNNVNQNLLVKINNPKMDDTGWLRDRGGLQFEQIDKSKMVYQLHPKYFEIIGNIYENPELLEGETK